MSSEEVLRDFILTNLKFRVSADQLTFSYPLLEREAIDSMGIFQLVGFIEEEYGVEISDEDLVIENFASIDAIAALVERKSAI